MYPHMQKRKCTLAHTDIRVSHLDDRHVVVLFELIFVLCCGFLEGPVLTPIWASGPGPDAHIGRQDRVLTSYGRQAMTLTPINMRQDNVLTPTWASGLGSDANMGGRMWS